MTSIFSRRRGGRENKTRDFWIITVIIILYNVHWTFHFSLVGFFSLFLYIFRFQRTGQLKWMGHVTIFSAPIQPKKKKKNFHEYTIYEGIHAHTFTQTEFLLSCVLVFPSSILVFLFSIIIIFFLAWRCWRPARAFARAQPSFRFHFIFNVMHNLVKMLNLITYSIWIISVGGSAGFGRLLPRNKTKKKGKKNEAKGGVGMTGPGLCRHRGWRWAPRR